MALGAGAARSAGPPPYVEIRDAEEGKVGAAVANPFEDPEGSYVVLVNAEAQHCLWPAWAEVPDGWSAAHGPSGRDDCLEYVERNWTDMRPASLVEAMRGA